REARRVCEQMADGGSFGTGRLVEVDRALLGCDERGEGGDELRHRRPAEDAVALPVRDDLLGVADDGDCDVRGGPALDLPQRVHTAMLIRWSAASYPRARRSSRRSASRAPCVSDRTSRLPAR